MKCFVLFSSLSLLSACTTNAPIFSWYHPLGGEYLFQFDANECRTEVLDKGMNFGTDPDGPFFSCMEVRGYTLVLDDTNSNDRVAGTDLVTND
jgi:hypothetical protein